jgi:hypothetical protein
LARYHAAVHGLPEQIDQWKLGVLAEPRITQMLGDEIAQAQSFIQLAYHDPRPSPTQSGGRPDLATAAQRH